jgi:hypothetical protein
VSASIVRRFAGAAGLVLVGVAAYLCFWPVPAELHGCFGPTNERARQNFYAEVQLGAISFRGNGECLALMIDFPETGLFPVRCHLILSGLPAAFVGGLLTTNTMITNAPFGGDTQPPGIHASFDRHDPFVEGEVKPLTTKPSANAFHAAQHASSKET